MNNKWIKETLTRKPEEYEKINDSTYARRINIEEIEDGENGAAYICDKKLISLDEYSQVLERREEIKKIVLETTNTAAYEDGYKAAMILLGGEE